MLFEGFVDSFWLNIFNFSQILEVSFKYAWKNKPYCVVIVACNEKQYYMLN